MSEVDTYAKIVWDYMHMRQELKPADTIFTLGANDLSIAERAAELYHQGLAPYVICAGGFGKDWNRTKPEAEEFADVLKSQGVPEDRIILETKSSNTGENILFVKELLQKLGHDFKSFILVQKPYMERRTYATFKKQWPEVGCVVTSAQVTYEEYAKMREGLDWIDVMVGDSQRIKEYPAKGFQIPQEIPDDVWQAYEKLVALGYTKYLIKE